MSTRRTPATILAAITAVLLTSFAGAGVAGVSAQASTASEVQAMAPETYESQVHYWINRERSKRGLPTLRMHGCTDSFANEWSRHLVATDSFYHQQIEPILKTCGARYASEALAWQPSDPRTTVTRWMQSSGHRRLLLSSKPRRLGVGAVLNADGYWIVAATFTRL